MEVDRMPKKIFTQELEGTRHRGRPRKGWKEEVERDIQELGVRRWRELVIDRKKWKDIVQQAKAHRGLALGNGRRRNKTVVSNPLNHTHISPNQPSESFTARQNIIYDSVYKNAFYKHDMSSYNYTQKNVQ
jgi:hypothetical protein